MVTKISIIIISPHHPHIIRSNNRFKSFETQPRVEHTVRESNLVNCQTLTISLFFLNPRFFEKFELAVKRGDRVVDESNSTLVGEAAPEMLNFHGNGSETAAFSRHFFPSPFIFPHYTLPYRMYTRFIPLSSSTTPSPHHFFRSLDEFSFARLPRVLFCPRKKAVSGDHFRVETEQFSTCFYREASAKSAILQS